MTNVQTPEKSVIELMHDIVAPRKTNLGQSFEKMKDENQETYCGIFDGKTAVTIKAGSASEADMKARFWARERGMNWNIFVIAKWQEDIS